MTNRRPAALARALRCSILAVEFGLREILFLVGLVLIAVGCWQVYRSAAPLVVGLVLVYLALPTRWPL